MSSLETPDPQSPEVVIETQQNIPFSELWSCFASTFVTIFLAELGDKTQVATLLMSAQSHKPWVVFTGAALALISTSLIGVVVGQWLSKILKPRTLELATGSILAIVSILLVIDVVGGL